MVTKKILDILSTVTDPEIPVLSVIDLGIIRDVMVNDDTITILVSPTYSGCPAMDMISMNIKLALITAGFHNVQIQQVLS
ncbi:MAG: iron-sulfur cluster assembly protein, partial [Sediminibacterium sp.]